MRKQHFIIGGFVILMIALALYTLSLTTCNVDPDALPFQETQAEIESLKREVAALKIQLSDSASASNSAVDLSELLDSNPVIEKPSESHAATEPTPLEPRLSVSPTTLDLGTVSKKAGIVKGVFKIKNEGGAPLELRYSLSSCGCTSAPLENKILEPQQVYDFAVEYDPNYFGPGLELGPTKKWISLMTNDPTNPLFKIYLEANVVP